jgi:alkylation response protein AidB-like acyl-CoA dehydrogenase
VTPDLAHLRAVRALRIYQGATEVQTLIIARDLLRAYGVESRCEAG